METITRYNVKIVQTRPNTDTPWYQITSAWQDAWNEFNKYDEEVTETVDDVTTTKLEPRLKFSLIPITVLSDDNLISTRIYYDMLPTVHDEFVALLNDDSSALTEEKTHDEANEITYQIVSEEEVREVVPPAEPEDTTP